MYVIFLLICISVLFAGGFVALYFWAHKSGQFDDTTGPAVRILFEEKSRQNEPDAREQTGSPS